MKHIGPALKSITIRACLALSILCTFGCEKEKIETAATVAIAPEEPLSDGIWQFGKESTPDVHLKLQIVDAYTGEMTLLASADRELDIQLPATTLFRSVDRNYHRMREVCLAEDVTLQLSTETQEFTLPYFFPADQSLIGYYKKPDGYRYEFKDVDYTLAKIFRRHHPKVDQMQTFLKLAKRDELNWMDVQTGIFMIKSDISLAAYHNAVQYAFKAHMAGKPRKTINYHGIMRVAELLKEMNIEPSDYELYRDVIEHVERNPILLEKQPEPEPVITIEM